MWKSQAKWRKLVSYIKLSSIIFFFFKSVWCNSSKSAKITVATHCWKIILKSAWWCKRKLLLGKQKGPFIAKCNLFCAVHLHLKKCCCCQIHYSGCSPRPTNRTGVLTLRRRACSPVLLEFPDRGKKLPVLYATNCSLQSAGVSGANRVSGRVTEAKATEFYQEWKKHIFKCKTNISKASRARKTMPVSHFEREIVEGSVVGAGAAAET